MDQPFRIRVAGENTFIIYFSNIIDDSVAALLPAVVEVLQQRLAGVLVDLVPAYGSVLVVFDVLRISPQELRKRIRSSLLSLNAVSTQQTRHIQLPVYYGEEVGIDLPQISEHAGLPVDEVIALHQAGIYRVYAIGFAPGFAYLGSVDTRIAMPRLVSPRAQVPKGAVAIADRQTAVYPAASPGGWHIIGRCPTLMFSLDEHVLPSMPVAVGDTVQFYAIDREQFLAMGGEL